MDSQTSYFREPPRYNKQYNISNLKTNSSQEFSHLKSGVESKLYQQNYELLNESVHHQIKPSILVIDNLEQSFNIDKYTSRRQITAQQMDQFNQMARVINFLKEETIEKGIIISRKKRKISLLSSQIAFLSQSILKDKKKYQRMTKQAEYKSDRLKRSKKYNLRVLTEQTQRMSQQVKHMFRIIKTNRKDKHPRKQQAQINDSRFNKNQVKNGRRRIYIPIVHAQNYLNRNQTYTTIENPSYLPMQSNCQNISTIHEADRNPNPENYYQQSSSNRNRRMNTQPINTSKKQPVLLQQLAEALTIKLKQQLQHQYNQKQIDLDYFDKSLEQHSVEVNQSKKILSANSKKSEAKKLSIKWDKRDQEDQFLVDILENSIKYNKNHSKPEERSYIGAKLINTEINADTVFRDKSIDRNNSSEVNITYESQDKRNSKSNDSKDSESKVKRSSLKTDKARYLNQSNVKIDGIEMSQSKNSSHSQVEIYNSTQVNRYLPSLNQQIQQIDQESEDLKTTPLDKRLMSSNQRSIQNANSKQIKKARIQEKINSQQIYSPLHKPPNLKAIPSTEDETMRSIKLAVQNQILNEKNNKNRQQSLQISENGQFYDDILGGINLLKVSRASRQKQMSLGTSINAFKDQFIFEPSLSNLTHKSDVFQVKKSQDQFTVDQSEILRMSTHSKISKIGSSMKKNQKKAINPNPNPIPNKSIKNELHKSKNNFAIEQIDQQQDDNSNVISKPKQ